MKTTFYTITALTNIHPGSGDLSYGVVDKLVQRDPATEFPVIHSSGLKGAMKVFFNQFFQKDTRSQEIFGDDKNPGIHKFFSAHLLTLPVRSDVQPFFNTTCPALLQHLSDMLRAFGFKTDADIITEVHSLAMKHLNPDKDFCLCRIISDNVILEEWNKCITIAFENGVLETLKKWFGDTENLAILRDDHFMELCEELPVIARNRIDDPKNKNLWYEELVPRQTVFWSIYCWPGKDGSDSKCITPAEEGAKDNGASTDASKNGEEKTKEEISKESPESQPNLIYEFIIKPFPVQIGANASIGQGFCALNNIITN